MPRDLILGTAGHIDHGKTSLIKALTGVDCDRLPEEKARGITIDIGFARLDLGDVHLGIVDVPGHERFIRNMLAGATGIDLALLVVAADDSIMPQTREHLEILQLLGITLGVVAVTKCDAVDSDTREVVALEVRDLVAGTFLADAPIVLTSATTGLGLDELKAALVAAAQLPSADSGLPFRLAIDRCFVVQGHGTVVTGSVTSGSLRVGDEVDWMPARERVRVRAMHHHDQPAEEVHRGMRAALNLAGVDHDAVRRGQELAAPGYLAPTRTLTVEVRTSSSVPRPLKHRTHLRLHLGTAEVMGLLSLLATDALAPGESGPAQIFLAEPVMAVWGQPFVIRESASTRTLGGGRVLQPVARKIRRRDEAALIRLSWLGDGTPPPQRVEAVSWTRGPAGFAAAELARDAGIAPADAATVVAGLVADGRLVELRKLLLHANAVEDIEERVLALLAKLHAAQPLLTTHERAKVLSALDYLGDDGLVAAVIDRMVKTRKLVGDAARVARADFKPKLTANQMKLKVRIVAAHAEAQFQPPDPASFANHAGGNASSLVDIFAVAVAEGYLVRITDDIHLHADAEETMRQRVRAKLEASPGLTVAEIRDLLGTSRKFAVPLCEYLDRVGVTRRDGDLRRAAQNRPAAGE